MSSKKTVPTVTEIERRRAVVVAAKAEHDRLTDELQAIGAKLVELQASLTTATLDDLGAIESSIHAIRNRRAQVARQRCAAGDSITRAAQDVEACRQSIETIAERYASAVRDLPNTLADADREIAHTTRVQTQRKVTAQAATDNLRAIILSLAPLDEAIALTTGHWKAPGIASALKALAAECETAGA